MVKQLDAATIKQFNLFLWGLNIPMGEAVRTKKDYEIYKSGLLLEINQEKKEEMKVLSILDGLGYPMDELGTYLYKDVIMNVIYTMKQTSITRRNMDTFRQLLFELEDAFSPLYHDIAREEKDMGVKPFHLYIESAIKSIDITRIDESLAQQIYGDYPKEIDYGTQAFMIAAYALGIYSLQSSKEFQRPHVKKIGNMPKNVELKHKYKLSEYV